MTETPEPSYLEIGPSAERPRRRGVALLAAGAVAGATGLGVTAVASARGTSPATTAAATVATPSTPGSTASPAPTPPAPGAPGRFGGRKGGGAGPGAAGVRGALHGEFVVQKSDGTYQTVDVQRGDVTAVSATSITVKSADGFTKTYAVTATTLVDAQRDGIASVKVGHSVELAATASGSDVTATDIADETLAPAGHPGFGGGLGGPAGHRPGDDGPPAPPVPSGSASGSTSGSTSGSAYTSGA